MIPFLGLLSLVGIIVFAVLLAYKKNRKKCITGIICCSIVFVSMLSITPKEPSENIISNMENEGVLAEPTIDPTITPSATATPIQTVVPTPEPTVDPTPAPTTAPTPKSTVSVNSETETEYENSETVYIGKTGNKYHKKNCSTLKGKGIPISLDEAIAQGREPCKRCGG